MLAMQRPEFSMLAMQRPEFSMLAMQRPDGGHTLGTGQGFRRWTYPRYWAGDPRYMVKKKIEKR